MPYFSIIKKFLPDPIIPQDLVSYYEDKIAQKKTFFPRIIHIETRSLCNGSCSFCASAIQYKTRPDVLMPNTLIDKLIEELSDVDYPNRVSFFNNNEPFVDKRIYEIVAKARKALPRAYLELKSNGKVLNSKSVYRIFDAGLDMLYINDYQSLNEKGQLNMSPKIKSVKEELYKSRRLKGHYEHGHYSSRIKIMVRQVDEVLGNRAGTAPNSKHLVAPLSKPCLRPEEMIAVDPNGQVALCSEDLKFEAPMGNVKVDRLLDIWKSKEYQQVRLELLRGNRSVKPTCAKCDYKGFTQEIIEEFDIKNPSIKEFLIKVKRAINVFSTSD